jgi:hypothetical protein
LHSQLEISVPRATDVNRLLRFFGRTQYEVEQTGTRTVALTPPDDADSRIARRELGVYLRVLERLHPGLGASFVD